MSKEDIPSGCGGQQERGRPNMRWMNGVKDCLTVRGLIIQEAKECVKDRRE